MAVEARLDKGGREISRSFGYILALLSFLFYVGTVFLLPQVRNSRYCCEQSSVAAAISNVKYSARLGTLYSGVFDYLIERFDKPLEEALTEAQTRGIGLPAVPPGAYLRTTLDGNGVGYPVVATVAFGLFGMHSWSLTLVMLLLMALSAATFLWRFPGGIYGGVVTLYFTSLTVMLFTPLMWGSYEANIPVGGIRYFSLVGVIPTFHLFLELLNSAPLPAAIAKRKNVLLGIQAALLALTILVRGSALPLIGAIVLLALVGAWRRRNDPSGQQVLFENVKIVAFVSATCVAVIALLVPPQYLTEGRFFTVIWQRVTESLGVHPGWPFPGVSDMFDCKKYVPGGLEPGPSDNNGMCIWFDYVASHNIPIETIGDKTFGSQYETALREAFYTIAARYRRQVLETFLYYKPRWIVWSIAQSMEFKSSPYPVVAIVLLLCSLAVMLAYFSVETIPMSDLRRITGVTLLAILFTIPSYLAAWAFPSKAGDLMLYCLFLLGLGVGAALVLVRPALRQAHFYARNGVTPSKQP
jgi:hypothetical protein